jgi:transcriptional regulator with XRE-family HTH domain
LNDLKINEEFKNLIPPLTEEEKTELEKSILMFGCRDKIIAWNNIIIDGHNRYEICTRNNVKYEVLKMDYDFGNEEEVKQWIIKNQFARRNISVYQRSILALQLKENIVKKAKENQSLAGGDKKSEGAKSLHQNSDKAINDKIEKGFPNSANLNSEDEEDTDLIEHIEVLEGQVNIGECLEFSANKDKESLLTNSSKAIDEEEVSAPVNTRREIAKIAGVSENTIHKVETIENEAPEIVKEAARENVVSINKAYNITKEVKDLDEEEKNTKVEELLNQQYQAKAKQIDKEKKIADKIADAIYEILTVTIDEERIGYYLEYSPKEPLEKHISRCDEAITKLREIKSIFENIKKIKVVK